MGRGIERTPEVVAAFLEAVESGTPGYAVSKRDDMPAWGTWCDWMESDPELAGKYARARNRGVESEEVELLEVARSKPADSVEAAAQRTLVDALKWHLSKRLPREFGDRQQVEHSGGVRLDVVTGVPEPTPDASAD